MCRVLSAPVRHNSHTNVHRQSDEDRCQIVLTPLVCASTCVVSSRAATGNSRAAAVVPRKQHDEAAAGTVAAVPNRTLHQSGNGTAAVQTARARYAIIQPQERLWPFAKEGWTVLRLRVALVRTIQPWRPDRQTDGRTCVCSVETTCSAAGTYGRSGDDAEREIIAGSKTAPE